MLAGGIGTRMGLDKPKQFKKVGDKPILIHSTETFLNVEEIDQVIVSSPKEYINQTKELINDYFPNNERVVVIQGGKTRNDTILNSIEYVKNNYESDDHILITHDAAKIFVSENLVKKSIEHRIKLSKYKLDVCTLCKGIIIFLKKITCF